MSQLIDNSSIEDDDDRRDETNMTDDLEENPTISIITNSSRFLNHSANCSSENEDKPDNSTESATGFNWNQLSANLNNKNNEVPKESDEQSDHGGW